MKNDDAYTTIPTWPRERDLATYTRYMAIDFSQELSDASTWLDVGCRTGKALHDFKSQSTAKLIGVNAHQIDVLPGIEPIFAEIPKDRSIYNRYRNKIDLVTDVYGAFTYDNDPLAVLIYEACLLKPKAKAVIISLEPKLGNRQNRQDIEAFFESVMGQKITFKRFRTYTDNRKLPLNSLRITITGGCRSPLELDTLLLLAQERIGIAKKVRIAYAPQDKSCEAWKIIYA